MGFECVHICKSFWARNGEVVALQAVDFLVGEEEFVCIVGPSGCGKTTLLKIIAGLVQPTEGEILYASQPKNGQPRSAMVFQEQGLFPWMTVQDNVAFGLEMQGIGREKRRQEAQDFLCKVGLADFIHSYPHELSGGMRQRVAILRAFLANPQILLMDEPFGSLDSQTRLVMQEELLRIWREHRKTVVYVTHDIEEAILLGDRVLVMSGRPGHIRQDIPITLERPRSLANSHMTQSGQDGKWSRAHHHTPPSEQNSNVPTDIAEIRWHIWKMLEDEVRKELHIAS
jgi:NitT/TauT family transport system ATP-binding protein